MMEEKRYTLNEWHRKQAIASFNATWDLMEKEERTREEDMHMIHMSHASRFHWEFAGTKLEAARGEWQISRVYSLLRYPESAWMHGQYSLTLCLENEIKDFDLAFAYEALARAQALSGKQENARKWCKEALKAAEAISKSEDKDYFLSELASVQMLLDDSTNP